MCAALSLLSSEDSAESGGDSTAPVGIRRLLTGGGDCRRLCSCAKSVDATCCDSVSVGVGGTSSTFVIEGDRLCLWRYEVEDIDRGGVGRIIEGDRGPPSSIYDELRLNAGLVGLEEAGDCCDGGVYGISANGELRWSRMVGELA